MTTQAALKKAASRQPLKKGAASNGLKKPADSDLTPELEEELAEANRLLMEIWESSYRRHQQQKDQ